MTFVPNEAGLQALLQGEFGPVGVLTRAATDEVARQARDNLAVIIRTVPVDSMVESHVRTPPLAGEVGAVDEGSISRRMALKAIDEANSGTPGDWLGSALDVLEPRGWTITRP